VGLVEPVPQATRHEVEVGLLQAQDQQRCGCHVGHGILQRDIAGERPAGLLGGHLLPGNDRHGLQAPGRVEPRRHRPAAVLAAHHEASVDSRGDVVGMPLELGSAS
jgi:hypothetical protein